LLVLAIRAQSVWFAIMCVFILMNCWRGLMQARALSRLANAPRHAEFACPSCQLAPPTGSFWVCGHCRKPFDMFENQGLCPNCNSQFDTTACSECGAVAPISAWQVPATPPPLFNRQSF
jgi:hypothetical protein